MKVKTSWTKLIQASNAGQRYLALHLEKTKLEYAIQRSLLRITKTNDTLQELLEDIDITHAALDSNGVCIMVQQGINPRTGEAVFVHTFKPEEKKIRNAARSTLLNKPDGVEIEAYFAIPEDHKATEECSPDNKKPGRCLCGKPLDLSESDLDAFEGIIITEADVARIREARERAYYPADSELKAPQIAS